MMGHVQTFAVTSQLSVHAMPEGFTSIGGGLAWANFQADRLPWQSNPNAAAAATATATVTAATNTTASSAQRVPRRSLLRLRALLQDSPAVSLDSIIGGQFQGVNSWVGRCRLTVSEPALEAPMDSALQTIIS
jgi:hypothetical protein